MVIEWYIYNTSALIVRQIVLSHDDCGVLSLIMVQIPVSLESDQNWRKNNVTGTPNNMYMTGVWKIEALPPGDWIRGIRSSSKSNMSMKGNGEEDKLQPFYIKLHYSHPKLNMEIWYNMHNINGLSKMTEKVKKLSIFYSCLGI